jgi:hypothetical protein
VVWKNDGTPIHDLGNLGGAYCAAFLINASGKQVDFSDMTVTHGLGGVVFVSDGTWTIKPFLLGRPEPRPPTRRQGRRATACWAWACAPCLSTFLRFC